MNTTGDRPKGSESRPPPSLNDRSAAFWARVTPNPAGASNLHADESVPSPSPSPSTWLSYADGTLWTPLYLRPIHRGRRALRSLYERISDCDLLYHLAVGSSTLLASPLVILFLRRRRGLSPTSQTSS